MKIEKDHTLLKLHNGDKVFVKYLAFYFYDVFDCNHVGIFNLVNKGVSDLETCMDYFAYPVRSYEKNTHSNSSTEKPV